MVSKKIKILLVGGGAVVSALAKKFKNCDCVEKIYATGGESAYFESIDVREDDLIGLLMFAFENDIDLTVPLSQKALNADIVSYFQSNGQNIFGPPKDSCDFLLNKIQCKKFLYKIHAQTPKFGMYNKISAINDYLKNSSFPVIISSAQNSDIEGDRMVCTTFKSALNFVEKLFLNGEQDVLIEDFVYGHNFTVYFVTDGYSALPLNVVGDYKFLSSDGGFYTNGCGAYCPDYKVSKIVISRIENIVSNILKTLNTKGSAYVGIIGVECVLTNDDNFVVTDVKPFLQNHDACAVLNLCEDDLIQMFNSCINGSFSDEYEQIRLNNYSSVSVCVYSNFENAQINGINSIEDIDFSNVKKENDKYYSKIGMNFVLTKAASTLSRAKIYLSDELEEINFEGMNYRNDICAKI